MTEDTTGAKRPRSKSLLIVLIIVLAAFAALIMFVLQQAAPRDGSASPSQDSYAAELAAAMNGAEADIGAELIYDSEYACYTCHLLGDGSQSPLFDGIGVFAKDRRPPLSAEQYLYEAILYPGLHLVEGYSDSMPNNYDERLSEQEVGHMIAYLLTLTEEPPEF